MSVTRRDVLRTGAAFSTVAAFSSLPAWAAFAPKPGTWRTFELITRVEIAKPAGPMQAWIPLPAYADLAWFKPGGSTWETNAITAEIARDPKYGAEMLHVVWQEGERAPAVEVRSAFATQSRAVDLSAPTGPHTLSDAERALNLAPTELIPTDGIVKETSDRITANAGSDLDKARSIYDWIVEATHRDAAVRGCGLGDIATMLQSGNLGGKCADLNALFVGFARAAGLPARDLYGLRVAPSAFGFASLGAKNEVVTKAQHCRAEVFLTDFGWVPVDPADVRKVMLEEPPGNLPLGDEKVTEARKALFGSWEGNWLAYNAAHDVALPGSRAPALPFLMYPQAEVKNVRLDCLDADAFKYALTAREIVT